MSLDARCNCQSNGHGSKRVVAFWGRCTTHFGLYFSGDWDVHYGYRVLTHGQMERSQLQRGVGVPARCVSRRLHLLQSSKLACPDLDFRIDTCMQVGHIKGPVTRAQMLPRFCSVLKAQDMWLWVKNRLKPVVPCWLNFDPHPCGALQLGWN